MRTRDRRQDKRLRDVGARMTVRQRFVALLEAGPDNAAVQADIGHGMTRAKWGEFYRYAERADQLNATTRDCLARVESLLARLCVPAYMDSTATLLTVLAAHLEDALDSWRSRSGREGAADRDIEWAMREAVRVLRGAAEAACGAGGGEPTSQVPNTMVREGVLRAHHLLRALKIEATAFASELDADPLDPELRTLAASRRAELEAFIDLIELEPPVVLTEPSDEFVTLIAARCWPEEKPDDAPDDAHDDAAC